MTMMMFLFEKYYLKKEKYMCYYLFLFSGKDQKRKKNISEKKEKIC